MKEIYEKLSIDIEFINKEDVITTSSSFDDISVHDNGYVDLSSLE